MLGELQKSWYIKYSTPTWQVPIAAAAPHDSETIRPPFDNSVYFTDIFRAYEYCIYHATSILLLLLYQDLSFGHVQPIEDILPGRFPNGSIQCLAGNICRCTEFLCLEQHGARGYIVLQLPATIAYLAIDKKSPEALWLYDVCKRHARRSGFGWGDFAMDQVTPLSQWMASCRDRQPDSESDNHLAAMQPCWARNSEGCANGSTSVQSCAALPMRSNGSQEGPECSLSRKA